MSGAKVVVETCYLVRVQSGASSAKLLMNDNDKVKWLLASPHTLCDGYEVLDVAPHLMINARVRGLHARLVPVCDIDPSELRLRLHKILVAWFITQGVRRFLVIYDVRELTRKDRSDVTGSFTASGMT